MNPNAPHYLRFAQALAMVTGLGAVGCTDSHESTEAANEGTADGKVDSFADTDGGETASLDSGWTIDAGWLTDASSSVDGGQSSSPNPPFDAGSRDANVRADAGDAHIRPDANAGDARIRPDARPYDAGTYDAAAYDAGASDAGQASTVDCDSCYCLNLPPAPGTNPSVACTDDPETSRCCFAGGPLFPPDMPA